MQEWFEQQALYFYSAKYSEKLRRVFFLASLFLVAKHIELEISFLFRTRDGNYIQIKYCNW